MTDKETTTTTPTAPDIEVKSVKHVFSRDEITDLSSEFHRAFNNLKVVNAEFDNVKATYKAKISEQESRMETLAALLNAGFEMKNKRCRVVFLAEWREKRFFLESDPLSADPVLIEEMTPADFQRDLFEKEQAATAATATTSASTPNEKLSD